jgi:hypothetical protein
MRTLSDHLVDIAQNSVKAGATEIKLDIRETEDKFFFKIIDNAGGMNEETLAKIFDPFFTSRDKKIRRVGLGLPFLKTATEATGGYSKVISVLGNGTEVEALFFKSNIDCQPVGNIKEALFVLFSSSDKIFWEINRYFNDDSYEIETKKILSLLSKTDTFYTPFFLEFLKENIGELEDSLFEIG